jgi:copper(I)-binding protein
MAEAASREHASVRISHAWSQATPPAAPTAVGYLTITNHGSAPDWLLDEASPAAASVQLHLMSMDGGVMRMRPVQGRLVVPAGGSVTLEPTGYHLMLVGLKRPFKAGDHIALTLRFKRAGVVHTVLDVTQTGGMPGMDMSGAHGSH